MTLTDEDVGRMRAPEELARDATDEVLMALQQPTASSYRPAVEWAILSAIKRAVADATKTKPAWCYCTGEKHAAHHL